LKAMDIHLFRQRWWQATHKRHHATIY